ncbi:MAG TPA: lipoyl(octanoyl) transferase LipB [Gammaproteobacteria bacterium]|nr:lipoyl(octanoyl) transferase LipB [Gammaproteobacteria bacterium]
MIIRLLGQTDYLSTWQRMQEFTQSRTPSQEDEIWLTEHPPVYTCGVRDSSEHIINKNNIPIIQTDRGGLITYHGPGQLIIYPLLNLKNNKIKPTMIVTLLENIVIQTLLHFNVIASANPKARGVYTQSGGKIASIGLRIKQHCSYHGMSFNVCMNLDPFSDIDPCGMTHQLMTDARSHIQPWDSAKFFDKFFQEFFKAFARDSNRLKITHENKTQIPSKIWPGETFH